MTNHATGWRYWLLFGLLIAASVLSSLAFACALPLAALAAVAVMHLDRGASVGVIAAAWLANQFVGYLLLDYPRTWDSFAWGGAILLAAVAAVFVSDAIGRRLGAGRAVVGIVALLGGFAAYEAVLALFATVLPGSWSAFAPGVVGRILVVNLLAFAGLVVLHRLGVAIGLVAPPRHAAPLPA